MVFQNNQLHGSRAWYYYPNLKDAMRFALASRHSRNGSPGFKMPGCVGMVRANVKGKDMLIKDIQASFVQSKSPELSRSLIDKQEGLEIASF